jgi:predicted component of type VI protein secretion system
MPPSLPPRDPKTHDFKDAPQVELQVLRGRTRFKSRPVTAPVYLIGAAPDCDLVLGDPQFPEVYAYLRRTEEGVTLRRLENGPELTVNGQLVKRCSLSDGDRIRTGPYEFLVHVRPAPASEASPSRHLAPEPLVGPLDPVEEHSAVLEGEMLLRDLRETLRPAAPALRLFIDPDMEIREANLQAARLGANWSWPRRRVL